MTDVSRRQFVQLAGAGALACLSSTTRAAVSPAPNQRVVIVMFDGFGLEYLNSTELPTLKRWRERGLYKQVKSLMPSVTNANNTSICCGVWPDVHGISGNSYLNQQTGVEDYMETSDLLRSPTLFDRAAKHSVRSALISSKKKSISLLGAGATLKLTPEEPESVWEERLGKAPPIYSREINYWSLSAMQYVLQHQPEIQVIYIHTTDYPMHMWPPEAQESHEHLREVDRLLGLAEKSAPDAAFLLTADHGMNAKTRCWDLARALDARGVPIRTAISVERDRYVKHHRGFGGASWIYLQQPKDETKVRRAIEGLTGIELVMTRERAAKDYHLPADRIGDLCIFGDATTVFGDLDSESEVLPASYRSHGSSHETEIPLFIFNASHAPAESYFVHNLDLARWLYPSV
ncbi:MAG: phosphonoacetate hydrolase [Blastocatellia bacterium]|jgi:phosphonoacetate hydrolase|nr:phosphonoacetate hydrolase [Blastocatellia bacterium]